MNGTAQTPTPPSLPLWAVFRNRPFAVIWLANTGALIGIAMFDTASGWLMTTLNADPQAVSGVQVAINLSMFLFTLPAGVLADVVDARRFLIVVSLVIAVLLVAFGTLVFFGLATPFWLLLTTFLLSAAWALNSPAWLAIIPTLAPRDELDDAVAIGSIGYNLSRVVGPGLGGLAIAELGMAAPFWAFAATNAAAIAALVWWRPPRPSGESLPAERLINALRVGLRHAAGNLPLRATMIRSVAIYPFAAAYLALLPLIASRQLSEGPNFYGVLLCAISAGALVGTFAISQLKASLGPDRLIALGSVGTAAALVLFGLARGPVVALAASFLAGATWIVVLASLYVAAQDSLPDWVRGRGLSIFLTVVFGAMTVGSVVWGKVAGALGIPMSQYLAAVGALVAIPLTWPWRLDSIQGLDLSPATDFVEPTFKRKIENDHGPVMVSVVYRVDMSSRTDFLDLLEDLRREREREGGFAWGIFEDTSEDGRFVETYLIDSWLEFRHLRERITISDRQLDKRVRALLVEPPTVALLIAPERRGGPRKWRPARLR
jgi:predicted MFS family arabinose efflux permease